MTTAHHWARELRRGSEHEVKLIPPAYVKAYVGRRQKNDTADAAAICEAVTRPRDALRAGEERGATGRADVAPGA